MKPCTVPGCSDPHSAEGYCNRHFLRVWKRGNTELASRARDEAAASSATSPGDAPTPRRSPARRRTHLTDLGSQLNDDVDNPETSERIAEQVEVARNALAGDDDDVSLNALRSLMDELETAAASTPVDPARNSRGASHLLLRRPSAFTGSRTCTVATVCDVTQYSAAEYQ